MQLRNPTTLLLFVYVLGIVGAVPTPGPVLGFNPAIASPPLKKPEQPIMGWVSRAHIFFGIESTPPRRSSERSAVEHRRSKLFRPRAHP